MRGAPLKRIALVVAGQSPPSAEVDDFTGEGLPFLQGNAEFGYRSPAPKNRCDLAGKRARRGDLLVSVRAPVGALNWADREYGIGRGLAAVRPLPGLDSTFCWWWLHAATADLRAEATGSTYEAVTAEDIGALQVPAWALPEQRAIAYFLDTETARIDALITKKRRMIDLVHEWRWTSFLARVRAAGAPKAPLRRALRFITDGPFGSAFTSNEYTTEGLSVIRLGNIGFAEFRNADMAYLPSERLPEFNRYRVRVGDLLFAGLGDDRNHAGRACVAPDLGEAIVKGKCFCGRLDLARAVPDYVAMFFSSPAGAEQVALEARGSTRSMINLEIIKSIALPMPRVSVQQSIVERTRREWQTVERLRDDLATQIALLQEHRQALLTAAVTGELAVPGVAA